MIAREVYADRLARHSDLIVRAARTRDPRYLQRFIDQALILPAPEGVDPAVALITVQAAQVPADVSADERLRWTHTEPTSSPESRLGWVDEHRNGAA